MDLQRPTRQRCDKIMEQIGVLLSGSLVHTSTGVILRIQRLKDIKMCLQAYAHQRAESREHDTDCDEDERERLDTVQTEETNFAYLTSLDSVSNIISFLKKKQESLKNLYMKTFAEYCGRDLIRQSVTARNAEIKHRYRDSLNKPELLRVEDAVNKWEVQRGLWGCCGEKMIWSRALAGPKPPPSGQLLGSMKVEVRIGEYSISNCSIATI